MPNYNKSQQTKKKLLEALEKSLGIVTTACKAADIDRTMFYRYYNKDKKFAAAVDDIQNVALDYVESKLFQLIKNDETAAIIFYMKTKGKKRGYVERFETTGADGEPIGNVVLYLPDNGRTPVEAAKPEKDKKPDYIN